VKKTVVLAAVLVVGAVGLGLGVAASMTDKVTVTVPIQVYFATQPSAACATTAVCDPTYPLDASTCASKVPASPETITANSAANHTVGDGTYNWGPDADNPYWAAFAADVQKVQGQFTGTTNEMFSWAGCRWGIDEDLLRAVAVRESDWQQSARGDTCGLSDPGTVGSFSIIQVKNAYCDGTLAEGGYPDTARSTALALDFYGAYLRACYDGSFYDGGNWLYSGQTVAQIAADHGWDYVLWGCVGSWFSARWYDPGARSYIASVKAHLANRDWTHY
jgi:hypothetical protein